MAVPTLTSYLTIPHLTLPYLTLPLPLSVSLSTFRTNATHYKLVDWNYFVVSTLLSPCNNTIKQTVCMALWKTRFTHDNIIIAISSCSGISRCGQEEEPSTRLSFL
ncbi:hypothetical protein GBAR_LOCUS9957 [Geodia barretti]|uniref:Uncharacterized protein n=1 Tax=Geodia barretti TaxID=519541 RepID=A0AA35WD55_GEOBA|nr:hypothetical protein GBAR_LOCUS9957 [Geodia barretti]